MTQGIPIKIEVRRACSPALMRWGMIWLGAGLQGHDAMRKNCLL